MAKYTFTCEHFDYNIWNSDKEQVASKSTMEFKADDLVTVLENFESFLRGSGFFFDGCIDVVNDTEDEYTDDEDELEENH